MLNKRQTIAILSSEKTIELSNSPEILALAATIPFLVGKYVLINRSIEGYLSVLTMQPEKMKINEVVKFNNKFAFFKGRAMGTSKKDNDIPDNNVTIEEINKLIRL
ncbi:hypothetical protein BCR21_13425 [Enterococcus ureasiticus]|uniref:Uncharacterized protein n=1 Tax=Enterococcus ureasiticus TaxID=903984 RepID=A0A1E5GCA9_9ENTE|nr:hypothetical protein BCR21_13425 [Enterococcus ureasiticus]